MKRKKRLKYLNNSGFVNTKIDNTKNCRIKSMIWSKNMHKILDKSNR